MPFVHVDEVQIKGMVTTRNQLVSFVKATQQSIVNHICSSDDCICQEMITNLVTHVPHNILLEPLEK